MNSIVAFGNPLLDTTVKLTGDAILTKYNLKPDGQKQITENEMKSLLYDIRGLEQTQSPGGCAQNTLRVMQWLLHQKFSTIMFGCVGRDEQGVILRNLLENDGVKTRYIERDCPTGISVCLTRNLDRSLVACLGAAEMMNLGDVEANSDLEAADLIYVEGFFLTKRTEIARYILNYCKQHKKTFAFNISGQYLCEMDPDNVRYFTENSDVVFGNRKEFRALASAIGINYRDFVATLGTRGKIVVVTDGGGPVICAHEGRIDEFAVPSIDAAETVDTTGAGDAFVAGFLAGWLSRRSPLNCTELGCYAAQEIIKRVGCTLPEHPPNVLL